MKWLHAILFMAGLAALVQVQVRRIARLGLLPRWQLKPTGDGPVFWSAKSTTPAAILSQERGLVPVGPRAT